MNFDNFVIPEPKLPTEEELATQAEAFQKTPHGIALRETVDLIAWLDRAKAADIPYIRGLPTNAFLTTKEINDLLENTATQETVNRLSKICEEVQIQNEFITTQTDYRRTMWRWNICAPMELKAHMADPQEIPAPTSLPNENLDDPRFFDIAYECGLAGLNQIHAVIRPWITPLIVDNYPVEFRVFVSAEGKTATTSYYPQRPLREEWRPYAEKATDFALALRPFVKEGVPYSADFLVKPDYTVTFLEGGPHFRYGGHPCCLNPQTFQEKGQIVLSPEEGAITQ